MSQLKDNVDAFSDLGILEKKKFLLEVLDKNMLYVNYSDIDDVNMFVTESEKEFTKSFYGDLK